MTKYKIITSTVNLNNLSAVIQRLEDIINQAEHNMYFAEKANNEQAVMQSRNIISNTLECLKLIGVVVEEIA